MRELLILIGITCALGVAALIGLSEAQLKAQVPCEAAGGVLVRGTNGDYVCVQPLIIKPKQKVLL